MARGNRLFALRRASCTLPFSVTSRLAAMLAFVLVLEDVYGERNRSEGKERRVPEEKRKNEAVRVGLSLPRSSLPIV